MNKNLISCNKNQHNKNTMIVTNLKLDYLGNSVLLVLIMIAIFSYLATVISINNNQDSIIATNINDYKIANHYNNLALSEAEQQITTLTCPDPYCQLGFANQIPIDCKKYNNIGQQRACALRIKFKLTNFANNCNLLQSWKGFCGNFINDTLYPTSPLLFLDILPQAQPPCSFYNPNLSINGKMLIDRLSDKHIMSSIAYNTDNTKLCTQPRYLIEFIDLNFQQLTNNSILYRITVKSFGVNGNISDISQEYFAVTTTTTAIKNRGQILSYIKL